MTRPGLVARWQLTGLLQRMIQSTREPGAAALFLLIPCNRAWSIEDALPVPGLPASQRLQVPGTLALSTRAAAPPRPPLTPMARPRKAQVGDLPPQPS